MKMLMDDRHLSHWYTISSLCAIRPSFVRKRQTNVVVVFLYQSCTLDRIAPDWHTAISNSAHTMCF